MLGLLFKNFKGETTSAEKDKIGQWLKENPDENAKIYKDARFIYEASILHTDVRGAIDNSLTAAHGYDSAPEDAGTASRVAQTKTVVIKDRRMTRILTVISGIAAAIAIFATASLWNERQTAKVLATATSVFETPAGQRADMTLPDGTRISLNAGSRIEYPSVFSKKERKVRLSGEAIFDVTPDKDRPFIVHTFASEVEVLGTEFNVLADEAEGIFATTLLRGKVKVTNISDRNDYLIMQPDQVVKMENGRLKLSEKTITDDLSWVEGKLNFSGQTFVQLMKTFEKAFGVNIVLDCKTAPSSVYSHGKVRISDGIDHALTVLRHTVPFSYTKDDETNTITITTGD